MANPKKKTKVKKKKECEHDFLAVVHCKKCGEQFHTDWLEALVEVKLNTIEEILRRVKTTINLKTKNNEDRKIAYKIAQDAFAEVKDVYEETKNTLNPKNL